jgi:hypothetical protein
MEPVRTYGTTSRKLNSVVLWWTSGSRRRHTRFQLILRTNDGLASIIPKSLEQIVEDRKAAQSAKLAQGWHPVPQVAETGKRPIVPQCSTKPYSAPQSSVF